MVDNPSEKPRPRPRRTSARPQPETRTIRSNQVRYPGASLPLLPDELQERYRAAADSDVDAGLSPVRDTGIAVEGRVARQDRARRRSQQRAAIIAAIAVVGAVLMVIGWRSASDQRAISAPLGGGAVNAIVGGLTNIAAGSTPKATPAVASTIATPQPTPYFASYKGLKLRLPVKLATLTEIGFHQASYGYALSMKTQLKNADLSDAGDHKGTGRNKSLQPSDPDAWLIGRVLRMWRPRPGRPDTAADVGSAVGSDVFAPVTGTVIKVKLYKLYGRWDDYEIHISPDGYPNLDLVMIHVKDVSCAPGDRVDAGLTRIAAVRKLSDKFYDQLASYTKNGGNHVHVQVNDATDPTYKGLEGAVAPVAPTVATDSSGPLPE